VTHRTLLAAAVLLTVAGRPVVQAQAPQSATAFSAEDILKVTTAAVLDVSDDGRYVAYTTRRAADNATTDHRRYGDPTYLAPSAVRLFVAGTATGGSTPVLPDLADIRQAAWSRAGTHLAFLHVQAGSASADPVVRLRIWDAARKALRDVPLKAETRIAANSSLAWSPDGSRVIVALRSPAREDEARTRFKALTEGPIIVHSSKDPFLEWDDLSRAPRWRSLADIEVATGQPRTILPERKLSSYAVARDGTFISFQEDVTAKTDYDVIGGSDNALRMVPASGGEVVTIAEAKDLKGLTLRWSDDGRTFAYAKKGEVFVQRVDEKQPRSLTPPPKKEGEKPGTEPAPGAPGVPADGAKDATPKEEPESFSVGPLTRDGRRMLITSKKGWYIVDVASASREQVLALKDGEEANPRMDALEWAPDGQSLYLTWSERDRWERGLVRLDAGTKALTPLVKDARLYSGFRQARDGRSFVFTLSDGDRPGELHSATADFARITRLTDLNPWMAGKALPKSELVSYRDADGKVLYGVLRYPSAYEKGKRYPTVFEIYETFFDNGFNGRAAFLASHGYAVFHPSVNLVVGRPGESWAKGVTAAANRLIDMGIADADRLGVHGTSYGGYATVLLLTQTDRFKAAINVSGKVNMVSFYTDSPRLGVRNTHAPEKSQDRIGGTLWEYPERYLEHSAILHADRITTPLLCITGDQDPNVPASQSREIYYALRRLGKEVEWVRYVNGAHRPPNSVPESVDFEQRMLAWYDKYLKADKAQKKVASSQ
jgi:dipeptidyl aminopeptidase/acylaminoacyl peptidase